ncbi:hybrid sensor histidine kinase/response regulator transcription factor [Flavihumibacter petaseus]|uniref:histidine kinase n=1 Tax=Flavihumibacter petaseus NBRC 106054 TaxID=1220578 RepID=A0A0E9N094_9BACT|nr:hybrid sensor histidine kinase/response regulator transcription factor [Flavihumibacter petaseus]GAO43046.1 putative two-component hybrid sensor and regulator [Flavihumibacter petaseus NBRC 106054]
MPPKSISPKLLAAIILTWLSVPAWGQMKYEWLTTSNGLSQGYVYDILQDKDGFLWFSTKAGLNRYDGYSFKVFTHDAYKPNTISSNVINRLYEDSKGRLWIGTEDNGLNIYDKTTGIFHRIRHDPNIPGSLSGNRITGDIIELPDGRFLVYASQKSFNLITLPTNYFESTASPVITRIPAIQADAFVPLCKDAKGRIWTSGNNKLYQFNPDKLSFEWRKDSITLGNFYSSNANGSIWTNGDQISLIDFDDGFRSYPMLPKSVTKGEVFVFCTDQQDRLWLGISNTQRLMVYDTRKWQKGNPLQPNAALLFTDTAVAPMKMLTDNAGTLWLGTNGYGIRKYTFESEQFNHLAKGMSVRKITPASQELFLTGWNGSKRILANGETIPGLPGYLQHDVHDYYFSRSGDCWILRLDPEKKTVISAIEQYNPVTRTRKIFPVSLPVFYDMLEPITEDREGRIWACGLNGQLVVIDPATGIVNPISINTDAAHAMLPDAFITALYQDDKGIFWIGTEEGFARLQYHHNVTTPPTLTWYRSNSNDKNSLNFNYVSGFLEDPLDDKVLWISTKGGGLNLFNTATGKFTHITTQEGLCNNVVYGILADEAGNIWGSTNNGIFCLLRQRKDEHGSWRFRHFTKASGLQDDEFNTGAYTKLSNGDLAFGGVNGVNRFTPATILQSSFSPNVFITSLLVGNEAVSPNDKTGILRQTIEQCRSITLNHLQDILTLEFAALDFTAPLQNKYRYQLLGMDKGWIESGTRRTATYMHLPPGHYTFKVQGSNSQGTWSSRTAELSIIVTPPWWRTWWAWLAYALLTGFAARAYFLFRVNKTKLQTQLHYEQEEAKRVKELDTLKTQLYANITHEFRTPLTVIMGMAQQVKSAPQEHLETGMAMIERNGQHLLNLVNEMLDLSKLEDGKMTLHLVNGEVINFLRYIVESFQSLATSQQKQCHFLSDTDELTVAYDAEKLRQIITNLLSNALKFTPAHGNVYVSISREPAAASDHVNLILKVKDTGIGIPGNQVPHIFDRFYQLDNSHTRKAEGTGIGLALTKELVKLMNGNITVKSPAVGATKGTEFTITLPLLLVSTDEVPVSVPPPTLQAVLPPVPQKPAPVIINNNHAPAGTPLILLVEDNVDVVAYTASCLPQYRLAVGRDGKEGFDIAVEMVPDLVITDVMMPFIDGFEMCRKLRQDERTSHIPIIMLTAKADMPSRLEGLERGADVYLEKPFHQEELLLRIKKLLELRKHLQQYYSRQIGISPQPTNATGADLITPVVSEPAEHEFVKKVRQLVEANFANYDFSVEQLCRLIFMSHSQLHRKLEALTGFSPNRFIRIIRLNRARALLTQPELSIASISLDCGYNDPGYFARVFKQEYGVTPQEWRMGKIKL